MKVARSITALSLLLGACGSEETRCGPSSGIVARAVDGDTIELQTGEKIRYLMVDTPETNGAVECYGPEAKAFNQNFVVGKSVRLSYDVECTDRFDRLLAYVFVDDEEVNTALIANGLACVLEIAPNGEDRSAEFAQLESQVRSAGIGLWGACDPNPCK